VLTQGDLERQGLTLYPALAAFDALITDMSSVWVDYLLLDKPMVFAFPDSDQYRNGRGLNLEPYDQWVPGPFAQDVDSLLSALGDVIDGRDPMAEERARTRVRFHQYLDDQSTVRLLDGLGLGLGSGAPS
jgi:CDP-glycerol glycerophosphotransferase (TagB/SpsB family)